MEEEIFLSLSLCEDSVDVGENSLDAVGRAMTIMTIGSMIGSIDHHRQDHHPRVGKARTSSINRITRTHVLWSKTSRVFLYQSNRWCSQYLPNYIHSRQRNVCGPNKCSGGEDMAAECLPDELWRRILELGTQRGTLTYRDLCCLSISARRMRRLSGEGSLWSILVVSDFPNNSTAATTTKTTAANASWKTVYRIRYEKDREKKKAAHRRAVLRLESMMAQYKMELKRLKEKREEEMGKLKVAVEELSRLEKVRQASVALNVWQPEVVCDRQKQIVEQCSVPVESRINTLQMEVKLCRLQIVALDRSHRDEQRRLERAKEELASMEYHPLRDYSSAGSMIRSSSSNINRKKLKREQDDAGNQGCSSSSSMYGYG